jgi:IMP dehydrogenase
MTGRFKGCTFDDVLIRPQKTDLAPSDICLTSEVLNGCVAQVPVIASPMDTVYSPSLAAILAEFGVLCPRPMSLPCLSSSEGKLNPPVSGAIPTCLTVSPTDEINVRRAFDNSGVAFVFVETAHAHSVGVLKMLEKLPVEHRRRTVLGNIATAAAAKDLVDFELAAVRVGLGSGSICTTSAVTGVGVPILQAIEEVSGVLSDKGTRVIADGGIRDSGDMAKALAAGAHCVMLGRMFAATTESGGEMKYIEGVLYKRYAGSFYNSIELSADRDPQIINALEALGASGDHRSEGVTGYVKHSGSARLLIKQIEKSLRTTLAFVGASSLKAYRKRAQVDIVSPRAVEYGKHHSIDIVTAQDRLMVA